MRRIMPKRVKPDLGRNGLKYLEALQEARLKLLDGYAKNDAIDCALKIYELPIEDEKNLRKHIHVKGAL